MKKLIFVLFVSAIFGACNTSTKSDNKEQKQAKHECSAVTVDSFLVVAADYLGKEITVNGTVDHVCKHGGKRVKIFSSCPSKSIHGEAGETMGNFKAEIEGSQVCLTGIVAESKMDMAYVEEYEAKIKASIEENKEEADMEHKQGVDHHAKLDHIAEWKAEIEASEKGYISTYFLEVSKYELCGETEKPCCNDAKKDSTGCEGDKAKDEKPCGDKKKDSTDCEGDKVAKDEPCGESKEEAKPCPHKH